MYLLSALAAGLVRCIYIDRLDKLSEGIGGQFREGAVPLYPLNKLLYILCLLFLFSSKENSRLGASSGRGLTLAYGSGLEK